MKSLTLEINVDFFVEVIFHLGKHEKKVSLAFGLTSKAFTAQKMMFSVKDCSVNMTKSARNCGFGHVY